MCACGAVLLGLMVMGGWHVKSLALVQVKPGLVVMHYLTALSLVVLGVGLVAHVVKWRRGVSLVCGLAAAVTGVVLLCEYVGGWRLGLDWLVGMFPSMPGHPSGKPSPPTAVAMVLCGSALTVLGLRIPTEMKRLVVWISGSLGLTLGVMILAGYATGLAEIYVWGEAIGMALHTAVGMTLLSGGILATLLMGSRRLFNDPWLPVPVGLGMAAATLIFWQALVAERYRAATSEVGLVAQDLVTDSEIRIGGPIRALERMKRRWNIRGGTPYAEWRADSRGYIEDERIYEAIEWADASWRVTWVVPEDSPVMGLDLRGDQRWDAKTGLEKAVASREMVVSPTIDLKQGGRGFLVYFPLFAGERFDGFLVGVFRLKDFMASVLEEVGFDDYLITIYEDGHLILGDEEMAKGAITARSSFEFHGHEWVFEVGAKKDELRWGGNSTVVLALGLILAVVLALAVRGYQQTMWRNREAKATNRKLQREVKDRRRAEKRLRESEERLAKVLDSATGVAVIGGSEEGVITYFSKGAEKLLGYKAEEMVGKQTPAIFHDPAEVRARAEELSRELGYEVSGFETFVAIPRMKGRERREWTYIRRDGKRRTVDLTVTKLGGAEKGGFLGTAVDMTENKKMERELEQARERAEANARAKAEFLANMSHEIRTPLNAVIGMSEMLMEAKLEEREREFVETIHGSGDVLLSLINDILDFSKIESGRLDLEDIPVVLRESVETALDLVAGVASKKHVELVYWIEPEVPEAVSSDPTRLRQVFVNLLSNAIKFTEEGEIFVRLSVRIEGGEKKLHVAVRDSGIGIPEDKLNRLFSAFSQVDTSTTRRYGGTGLGLAISHRIVQKMGGRIWVESEVGRGSTFQFEVPLREAGVPAKRPTVEAGRWKGARILVVDDSATNRWILQMQIESWGMRPTVVEGAVRALDLIRAGEKFDAAIVDGMMPEMDGFELVEAIRQHWKKSDLPILMLTSIEDRDLEWRTLDIAGVISKPVKAGALFRAIREMLGEETKPTKEEAKPGDERLGDACPLKVLLAEDNLVNQRVATLLLQRIGYQADVVGNGLQALEALGRAHYDMVLLDVQMPEMDGLETAREINSRYPNGKRPWLVALTAYATESDKGECLAAGMDDYLPKPVRMETLMGALRKACDYKKASSAQR